MSITYLEMQDAMRKRQDKLDSDRNILNKEAKMLFSSYKQSLSLGATTYISNGSNKQNKVTDIGIIKDGRFIAKDPSEVALGDDNILTLCIKTDVVQFPETYKPRPILVLFQMHLDEDRVGVFLHDSKELREISTSIQDAGKYVELAELIKRIVLNKISILN
jgi:hypothetical protein